MQIHEGHRNRLKERFENEGLRFFEPHEVLELFLYYSIPYKDTNPIAHNLLNAFGSIDAIFNASVDDLVKIDGISYSTAVYLKMIPELCKYYRKELLKERPDMGTLGAVKKYLHNLLVDESREVMYMMCLDTHNKLIRTVELNRGTYNRVEIYLREIQTKALQTNAVSVVFAHNHPGRVAIPSADDIRSTEDIVKSLAYIEINVYDHIIVGGSDYYSFNENGLLDQCKQECPQGFIADFRDANERYLGERD